MHGPAIGDGDGIKGKMKFCGQIKRHLLRALRLDNPLILAKDHLLKVLQDAAGLFKIVVATNDAVANTAS